MGCLTLYEKSSLLIKNLCSGVAGLGLGLICYVTFSMEAGVVIVLACRTLTIELDL